MGKKLKAGRRADVSPMRTPAGHVAGDLLGVVLPSLLQVSKPFEATPSVSTERANEPWRKPAHRERVPLGAI
jgi:hypothetical protein